MANPDSFIFGKSLLYIVEVLPTVGDDKSGQDRTQERRASEISTQQVLQKVVLEADVGAETVVLLAEEHLAAHCKVAVARAR
jgi:hypothetical protein